MNKILKDESLFVYLKFCAGMNNNLKVPEKNELSFNNAFKAINNKAEGTVNDVINSQE